MCTALPGLIGYCTFRNRKVLNMVMSRVSDFSNLYFYFLSFLIGSRYCNKLLIIILRYCTPTILVQQMDIDKSQKASPRGSTTMQTETRKTHANHLPTKKQLDFNQYRNRKEVRQSMLLCVFMSQEICSIINQ